MENEALELSDNDNEDIEIIIDDADTEDENLEIEPLNEELSQEEEESQEKLEVLDDEPVKKKMSRAQQRIIKLNDKNKEMAQIYETKIKDLENKIHYLSTAEESRSQKEVDSEHEIKFKDITEKQKQAFEDGDFESVQKYNLELLKINKPITSVVDDLKNPSDKTRYFCEKNPWYDNDSLDPGKAKTRYARDLSNELMNDRKYSNWSTSEILDEVAKVTNAHFRINGFKKSSPTEGVSNIVPSRKKTINITRDDYDAARLLYPELINNPAALNKKISEYLS